MAKYLVSRKDKTWTIEAADFSDAMQMVLDKEGYKIENAPVAKQIKMENQLDPKWDRWYIGKVKTSKFKDFACYLFCWTYIYSVKLGRQVSPSEVDKIFVEKGVYDGDLIISSKATEALGLQYLGYEKDIKKSPDWFPNVKRVDFSAAPGKQYHFVVREKIDGKKVILDPVGGVVRPINYYEKLVGDESWGKDSAFNYRLIKI